MRSTTLLAIALNFALAGTVAAQEKSFEWQPANDESVRLDPANYHTGRTYHPGPNGGGIHVDIDAQQPVTIFLTGEAEWQRALQAPETVGSISMLCLREHVVKTTYICDLPAQPMTLVVRDDRGDPSAKYVYLGQVLKHEAASVDPRLGHAVASTVDLANVFRKEPPNQPRHFVSPNDVHIQYYRWACVANCYPPQFEWIKQAKEKYDLTSFLKVYGGYQPDRDGEVVSVKIKAPVPMLVAVLPSPVANQLHSKPEMLQTALEKNSCQQRGVQSQTFECTFNQADGPQSLIVVPEDTNGKVPHKKTEVEFWASKCVANCVQAPETNASAKSNQ